METKTTSQQFSVNWADAGKGLVVAVITAVLTALLPILESGTFDINWKQILIVGATAGVGYLLKNFFTPTEVVVKKVPDEVLNQVQRGKAEVNIKTK
jgi:hypothetical protein